MMTIHHLQGVFHSHMPHLFIGLLLILILLIALYFFLRSRYKNETIQVFRQQTYYERAEEALEAFPPLGKEIVTFWGRQTPVSLPKGGAGLRLIVAKEFATSAAMSRFQAFLHSYAAKRVRTLAPYVWSSTNEIFAFVQNDLVRTDGKMFYTLKHYYADQKLSLVEREKIAEHLIAALACLHKCVVEGEGPIYHGFLHPNKIYIALNEQNILLDVRIGHTGLAFAVGPESLYRRMQELIAGKLPVDKSLAEQTVKHLTVLAPEQKSPAEFDKVGPLSDVYAFGALGVMLFSQNHFSGPDKVDWHKVPARWQGVLKACISVDPKMRPQSFEEIETAIRASAATLTEVPVSEPPAESPVEELPEDDPLERTVEALKALDGPIVDRVLPENIRTTFESVFEAGKTASNESRWDLAKKYFEEACRLVPDDAEAHARLAIACYELGDMQASEEHYQISSRMDPLAARVFRKHLSFRV